MISAGRKANTRQCRIPASVQPNTAVTASTHLYEDLDSALRDFCAYEHLGARLYLINDAGEKEYWFWDFWHRYGCFQTACFDADGLFPSDYQKVNCERVLQRSRPVWVDNIRRQCEAAGTAFFFKQWGGEQTA
ncbi:DUF5131 family protein [Neisseria dumasiana]|uniref:DUF5131 family protein n=1 Tax=Neisseria dumasiana TaxID=1931275 RepID=UPI003A1031F5